MALGAVLLSFPLAMIGAYLVYALLGLNFGLGILVYAALGTLVMAAIMVFFASRRS